jgi:hypothetical protein
MGAFGRAIGNFGSQVGEASQFNEAFRQRQAQANADLAMQKLQQSMFPLQMQELKQRIASQQQQQSLAPWQSFTTRNPDGSVEQGLYNIQTGDKKIISKSIGQAKYTNTRVDDKGQLVGTNSNTGLEEIISLPDGVKFAVPGEKREEVPHETIFGGYKWKFDPEKKIQGKRDPTGQYVQLGLAKEPGAAADTPKTPFDLWKQGHPGGTYEQWQDSSKQDVRVDATKAVTNALAAYKNYQAQVNNSQRVAASSHWYSPGTWGSGDVSKASVDGAAIDLELKRQDAIDKLTQAGMPVPAWLTNPIGGSGAIPPPPNGAVVDKP